MIAGREAVASAECSADARIGLLNKHASHEENGQYDLHVGNNVSNTHDVHSIPKWQKKSTHDKINV